MLGQRAKEGKVLDFRELCLEARGVTGLTPGDVTLVTWLTCCLRDFSTVRLLYFPSSSVHGLGRSET